MRPPALITLGGEHLLMIKSFGEAIYVQSRTK